MSSVKVAITLAHHPRTGMEADSWRRAVSCAGVASGRPFLIAQLSDPHLGAEWADRDPAAGLRAVVASVQHLNPQPDIVVVTGDLADHAADGEYAQARDILGRLQVPTHVLPGNHDDRGALRRHFGLPGEADDVVQYAVDVGPVRVIVLDSTRPGEDSGELDAARLVWLDAALAEAPDTPTVLALHHPPLLTGVPVWDELALAPADQAALADVVSRHRQIRRMIAGHVHRMMATTLADASVITAPSTYVQAALDYRLRTIELTDDAPGFVLHAMLDGRLVSHFQAVPEGS
jgi:3',5'-cyclic-AMP phosphodiesterase